MEWLLQFFHLLFVASLLICSSSSSSIAISDQIAKPYVVYMGNSSPNKIDVDGEIPESVHLQLLSSIIPSEESERIELIHHYNHAFSGFSAMLTEAEASTLSGINFIFSAITPLCYLNS
ncbi:unnamed protein product [Trifolium pratense]|uniref:Uncharacterized protein n=1 Tax=Trifolium pratense TaxID=57577 RepID=A0ACB0KL17_TRIPR|nr:unnamed protein product [Trifolium pratense]